MEELIRQAQEAIDSDDMKEYERIQQLIKESYKDEEIDSR